MGSPATASFSWMHPSENSPAPCPALLHNRTGYQERKPGRTASEWRGTEPQNKPSADERLWSRASFLCHSTCWGWLSHGGESCSVHWVHFWRNCSPEVTSKYLPKIDGASAEDKCVQNWGCSTGASDSWWKHLLASQRGMAILQGVNVLVSQPMTGAYKLIIVIRDYSILARQQTC